MTQPETVEERLARLSGIGTSPAFNLALEELKLNRFMAMRAYLGIIEGLRFDKCEMCEQILFLMPSGLKGWTCTPCELAHDKALKEPVR